uniref:Variant surface glycoprotein n=1 Tax=Trypanosoma brucei TaxID=5691 RepID=A0A1V0FZW0_9TRYP|nr:variant surface glycoprotein [Trypanosoma brucei]
MFTILLAATIAAITLRQHTHGGKGDGLKQSAWQPLCQISEELNKVAPNAAQRLVAIAKRAEEQSNQADRLTAFALQTDDTTAAKRAVALAGLFRQLAAANSQLLTQGATTKTAFDAVAENLYNKGRIDEALTILGRAQQGAGGCLVQNSGNSVAAISATQIGPITCSRKLSRRPTSEYADYDNIIGPQGLLTKHATTANTDQSDSSGKTCPPLKIHTAGIAGEK